MPRLSLSRRRFACGLAATAFALPARAQVAAPAPPDDGFRVLEAREGLMQIRPEPAPKTAIWGYDGIAPGPVIRLRKGDEVKVRLKNSLAQPTSLHWHGVRIVNAMDGAAGLTQAPVAPGGTFDYRFTAPDAGTYWYHPHVHGHTSEQLDRGLHGLLIVDEPNPPPVTKEIVVVLDDWRLDKDSVIDPDFGRAADMVHAGRLGNVLTTNGRGGPMTDTLQPNARVRLRVVNVANSRVMTLRFESMAAQIIAIDGQPTAPFVPKNQTIVLPPGGRFDAMVDLADRPGEKAVMAAVFEQSVPLLTLTSEGEALPKFAPVAALPPNDLPEKLDLARARRFDLVMEGGVDPNAHGPAHMQMMMNPASAWKFNGQSLHGHEAKPFFSVKRGTTVVISMINKTKWPHAMHIHGHHVRTLFTFDDGWDPFWLDTGLVDAGRTLRMAFVADNPGKWMLHCHMIEHQAAGMATWFEVT